MKKLLFVVLAVCLLCVGGVVMSHAAVDITEEFTDLNFRAVVYEAIGKTAPAPILDTDVEGKTYLFASSSGIQSLNGLIYFTSLQSLYCSYNHLTALPTLPGSLKYLDCAYNQLTALPALPTALETLGCSNNPLSALPALPGSLKSLYCGMARLAVLPALPSGLTTLNCSNNEDGKGDILPDPANRNTLTSLPTLPTSLQILYCEDNQLTLLPTLPLSLRQLFCDDNQLTSLPTLRSNLIHLYCSGNKLTALPTLPSNLDQLNCDDNQLTSLPTLPSKLYSLSCDGNKLTALPALPSSLRWLYCSNNKLTSLPALPSVLVGLYCYGNKLASLPALPTSLQYLDCHDNQLTSLNLTGLSQLTRLNCSYNNMTSKTAVTGFTGTWGGYFVFDPQNPISPALTGPTAMTLMQGYAATATGAFTATGNPAPTVTKTDGDAKITWNDTTGRLEIAADLAAGTYPVALKASNGVSPDAELTFTLTVTSPPPPRGIFGTNPKWSGAWWHYLLFFFCFGFLWMWF